MIDQPVVIERRSACDAHKNAYLIVPQKGWRYPFQVNFFDDSGTSMDRDIRCSWYREETGSTALVGWDRMSRSTPPITGTGDLSSSDLDALLAGVLYSAPARSAISPENAPKQAEELKFRANHAQLTDYLKRVSTGARSLITTETAEMAMRAWIALWEASGGRMAAPAACTGPDGELFYSWDRGRHHLELEIIPGEPAEFFYRDRETEDYWGEDYRIGEPLPTAVVHKLGIFR